MIIMDKDYIYDHALKIFAETKTCAEVFLLVEPLRKEEINKHALLRSMLHAIMWSVIKAKDQDMRNLRIIFENFPNWMITIRDLIKTEGEELNIVYEEYYEEFDEFSDSLLTKDHADEMKCPLEELTHNTAKFIEKFLECLKKPVILQVYEHYQKKVQEKLAQLKRNESVEETENSSQTSTMTTASRPTSDSDSQDDDVSVSQIDSDDPSEKVPLSDTNSETVGKLRCETNFEVSNQGFNTPLHVADDHASESDVHSEQFETEIQIPSTSMLTQPCNNTHHSDVATSSRGHIRFAFLKKTNKNLSDNSSNSEVTVGGGDITNNFSEASSGDSNHTSCADNASVDQASAKSTNTKIFSPKSPTCKTQNSSRLVAAAVPTQPTVTSQSNSANKRATPSTSIASNDSASEEISSISGYTAHNPPNSSSSLAGASTTPIHNDTSEVISENPDSDSSFEPVEINTKAQVKHKKRMFDVKSDAMLIHGVKTYGVGCWKLILVNYKFPAFRTPVHLKDRWRTMLNKNIVSYERRKVKILVRKQAEEFQRLSEDIAEQKKRSMSSIKFNASRSDINTSTPRSSSKRKRMRGRALRVADKSPGDAAKEILAISDDDNDTDSNATETRNTNKDKDTDAEATPEKENRTEKELPAEKSDCDVSFESPRRKNPRKVVSDQQITPTRESPRKQKINTEGNRAEEPHTSMELRRQKRRRRLWDCEGETLTWKDDPILQPRFTNKLLQPPSRFSERKHRRKPWSEAEVANLIKGMRRFGVGQWAMILDMFKFDNRNSMMLKDKYRNLLKSDELPRDLLPTEDL